tara:strand:+ start:11575 stop:13479 length:1905 start_codon:yes stop_codon:yes gene_type:complete
MFPASSVLNISSESSLSAEERLLLLKDAVSTLISRERGCVYTKKHLRLDVSLCNDSSGKHQVLCDMQGGFGRVVSQNELHGALGLPDDSYVLTITGPEINKAEMVRRNGLTDTLELRQQSPGEWRFNVKEGLNKQLLIHLNTKDTLHFDFLNAHCYEEESNSVSDSKFHVHWLSSIADDVKTVGLAASSVAEAESVCIPKHNALNGDPKAKITVFDLKEELSSLNRKLTRIVGTAQRLNDRYLVSGNDGWYDLFAPGGKIFHDKSVMRVTSDNSFIQNDLLQLQENVALIIAHVQKLGEQELVYEPGDIDTIVQNLFLFGDNDQHITSLETLCKMRQNLLSHVSDAIHAGKDYKTTHKLDSVVNRRAHFITLSCVDAGLRAQVRLMSEMPMHNCLLDIDMGAYQMRQIMANNGSNDIKLDVTVAENCLQKILSIQSMIRASMQTQNESRINQSNQSDQNNQSNEHVLVGAIRVQKILHALSRNDCVHISTGFNHYYRNDATSSIGKPFSTEHCEQMCTEMQKNKMSSKTTTYQAQCIMLGMLDADLRHRIISPLIHKHVKGAIIATQEGKECTHADQIVNIYKTDIQLLVKLALGMQESAETTHTFAFLNDPLVHTGYNDDNKTSLLVNLMFKK